MAMIDAVIHNFGMCLDHLRRMLTDVDDAQMTVQPRPGMNHPAWILGHLIHGFQDLGSDFGVPPWLPDDWADRFAYGSMPSADRAAHPSKAALLEMLDGGQARLVDALADLNDERLTAPLPDPNASGLFSTLGDVMIYALVSHTALHVGQLTAWRRAMALPLIYDASAAGQGE